MNSSDDKRRIRLLEGVRLTPVKIGLALAGILALFLVPEVHGSFDNIRLSTTHRGLLFGLAAVGLNLLLRHTGLVSFGHAAFFGGGAYGGAALVSHTGVERGLLIILGAVLVATSLAVIIGWLVAGHVDIYFALLTLAFNQVLFAIVLGSGFFNYSDGLSVRPDGRGRPSLFGIDFGPTEFNLILYYLTILIVIVSLLVMWRLINSPFGRALDAIGQNRTRARFIGVPVKRYVWGAFVISGVYGGIAGGLFALLELRVLPEPTLFVFVSGEILFMAILGGFQTLTGPLVGGVILTYFLDNARFVTEYFNALTGIVLLLIVFVLPKGVVGSVADITVWARRRVRDPGRISDDIAAVTRTIISSVRDAVQTTRVLLFGVN